MAVGLVIMSERELNRIEVLSDIQQGVLLTGCQTRRIMVHIRQTSLGPIWTGSSSQVRFYLLLLPNTPRGEALAPTSCANFHKKKTPQCCRRVQTGGTVYRRHTLLRVGAV